MHIPKFVIISLSCTVANAAVLGTPTRNTSPSVALEPRRNPDKMDPGIGGTPPPPKPKATAQIILDKAAANLHDVTTPVLPKEPPVPSPLLPTTDEAVKQLYRSAIHEYNEFAEKSRVVQDMEAAQSLKRLMDFKKMNQCAVSGMNIEYCDRAEKEKLKKVGWEIYVEEYNDLLEEMFGDMKKEGLRRLGERVKQAIKAARMGRLEDKSKKEELKKENSNIEEPKIDGSNAEVQKQDDKEEPKKGELVAREPKLEEPYMDKTSNGDEQDQEGKQEE